MKTKIIIFQIIILAGCLQTAVGQNELVAYEYWFNNNYSSVQAVSITPAARHKLVTAINTTTLPDGVNVLNIRYKDQNNHYSSTLSQLFYKNTQQALTGNQLTAYEYWFNNDYSTVQTVSITPAGLHQLVTAINTTTLPDGINVLNIRYKDQNNHYSSTISQMFFKRDSEIVSNKIKGYRYWFNEDFNNAVHIALTNNVNTLILSNNIDMTQIPKGEHVLHFQFQDTLNMWSVVTSDTIVKNPLPIADFSYTVTQYCDSAIVNFTNNSIDGDTYLWDFGDGNSDTIANTGHVYYTPDNYSVSLTVTDTVTGTDSTLVIPVTINPLHTYDSIIETFCGSYTAPDGQVYTSTGTYTAIIPNAMGCDSTINIDLTIINMDTSVTQDGITLTANATGASYRWLDCNNGFEPIVGETNQSFAATQNGSYAVEITANGCVDTSACNSVTIVSVVENTFNHNIVVFPNPTYGKITVKLEKPVNEFKVKITDLNGRVIVQSKYKDTNTFELNLAAPSGVYFLTIESDKNKSTIRLIKN